MTENYFTEDEQAQYERLEHEEALRERHKNRQLDAELDARANAQAEAKFFQDTWVETLKEAGLDPQSYAELVRQDPEIAKTSLREGMQHMVGSVRARARDPKTGQFVKAPPGQQAPAQAPVQQSPQAQPQRGLPNLVSEPPPKQSSGALTQALKEKVAKGYVPTEEEILDSIGEAIGGNGSLIR